MKYYIPVPKNGNFYTTKIINLSEYFGRRLNNLEDLFAATQAAREGYALPELASVTNATLLHVSGWMNAFHGITNEVL